MKTFCTLLLLSCSACVVTTLEGPGDPPRVQPPPSRARAEQRASAAAAAEAGPESIGGRHILVSYKGADRASPVVTRSKEEAQKRAQEVLTRARAGEDFEALVKEFSDEPGAAQRGGDLGRFTRRQMVKPFTDAAFKLGPGELSDVVETGFGFHVIQRTE